MLPLKILHNYPWAFNNLSNAPNLPLPSLLLLWLTFAPSYKNLYHLLSIITADWLPLLRLQQIKGALYKDHATPVLQGIQRIFGNHRNNKFLLTYCAFRSSAESPFKCQRTKCTLAATNQYSESWLSFPCLVIVTESKTYGSFTAVVIVVVVVDSVPYIRTFMPHTGAWSQPFSEWVHF